MHSDNNRICHCGAYRDAMNGQCHSKGVEHELKSPYLLWWFNNNGQLYNTRLFSHSSSSKELREKNIKKIIG